MRETHGGAAKLYEMWRKLYEVRSESYSGAAELPQRHNDGLWHEGNPLPYKVMLFMRQGAWSP